MIIYPAIDLKEGRVVRLHQGDLDRQTVYSDDPVTTAKRWLDDGATWLHVVNLDGAFSLEGAANNERIVEEIARLGGQVQFGGGLRTQSDVQRAFDSGIKRAVIGTAAVYQPEILAQLITRWGTDAIAIALDARDGKVATHGWVAESSLTPIELGQQVYGYGVRHALYTDVARDGALTGVNVRATVELARQTNLHVIASGGVSGLPDVQALKHTKQVAGVILGRSLYAGTINLREALALAAAADTEGA